MMLEVGAWDETESRQSTSRSTRTTPDRDLLKLTIEVADRQASLMADQKQTAQIRPQVRFLSKIVKYLSRPFFVPHQQIQQQINRALLAAYHRLVHDHERLAAELAALKRSGGSTPAASGNPAPAAESHGNREKLYLEFENTFRGSKLLVRRRLETYLPIIRAAGIGGTDKPLLDVGSGRGEWLDLAAEAGWHAWGLDSNRVLADECRGRGLKVVDGHALDYLCTLPAASLGAVTAFHVVEHLPAEVINRFLEETCRVLKPGGLAIFETPNPENVVVGASTFYTDQTHNRPVHPEVLSFLVEQFGFSRAEVLRLREARIRDELPLLPAENPLASHLNPVIEMVNARFLAAPDYAVVARKA
jgi:SAM-dependent methyltransferase